MSKRMRSSKAGGETGAPTLLEGGSGGDWGLSGKKLYKKTQPRGEKI